MVFIIHLKGDMKVSDPEKKSFNLVDENWISTTSGLVSLRTIFSNYQILDLVTNSVDRISLLKFLLAIVHTAWTPKDKNEWKTGGVKELSLKVCEYLNCKKELFDLYGETPFLQYPELVKISEPTNIENMSLEISTGNNVVLWNSQRQKTNVEWTNSEKVMVLLSTIGFGLAGQGEAEKKQSSKGKSRAKEGPFLEKSGVFHYFLLGQTILETLWLNLWTLEDINKQKNFTAGLGLPPWEKDPDKPGLKDMKTFSYIDTLLPMNRFCFYGENNKFYCFEGVKFPETVRIPTMAYLPSNKKNKSKKTDMDAQENVNNISDMEPIETRTEKRAWNFVEAVLTSINKKTKNWECVHLENIWGRAQANGSFKLWIGGIHVGWNSGNTFVDKDSNFIESSVDIPMIDENDEHGVKKILKCLTEEVEKLKLLQDDLYKCVEKYWKEIKNLKNEKKTGIGMKSSEEFWNYCAEVGQDIINSCFSEKDPEKQGLHIINKKIKARAMSIYNLLCPKGTARQIEVWAKHRPEFEYNKQKGKSP